MNKNLPQMPAESVFNKMFDMSHVDDSTVSAAERAKANQIGDCLSDIVDGLRNSVLPRRIVKLAAVCYDLIGSRITPAAVTDVPSVHFFFEIRNHEAVGVIMLPANWLEMVKADYIMQVGAIIFAASQAQDFYNQKYYHTSTYQKKHGQNPISIRAKAYEAEFLLWVKRNPPFPGWTPTDYQVKVLEAYPLGYDSLPEELQYESIPTKT